MKFILSFHLFIHNYKQIFYYKIEFTTMKMFTVVILTGMNMQYRQYTNKLLSLLVKTQCHC